VIAVDEDAPVSDARRIMEAHKIRRLPVMKKDRLVGLVTERMLLEVASSAVGERNTHESDSPLTKMPVKEIMVRDPYTLSPDMPPEEALQLGQEMGYGAFPVVEGGRLVGVVTESDIVRLMTRVLGVTKKGKRITISASPEEKDWLIVLRVESKDAEPIAKELNSAGFNVTYVG